jgi:hypothetical protein
MRVFLKNQVTKDGVYQPVEIQLSNDTVLFFLDTDKIVNEKEKPNPLFYLDLKDLKCSLELLEKSGGNK